jgi:hypothetical protein
MDDTRRHAGRDKAHEIADASSLFGDAPAPVPKRPGNAQDQAQAPAAHESYDVADAPPPSRPSRTPQPEPARKPSAAPTSGKARAAAAPQRPPREPEEAVEQVWTRQAEWAGSIAVLAVVGGALFVTFYALAFWFDQASLAFLLLVVGGLVLVLLSYPILITLERPVRITPEQAVRDYFAALSHHFPHYKRMWLLLSREGHTCGSFGSFEGFRGYWKERLAELKRGKSSGFTPLKFKVDGFHAEKSAGKSEIDARYTVKVFVRGKIADGPVASVDVETTLVKGPDKMWYLDRGTLP